MFVYMKFVAFTVQNEIDPIDSSIEKKITIISIKPLIWYVCLRVYALWKRQKESRDNYKSNLFKSLPLQWVLPRRVVAFGVQISRRNRLSIVLIFFLFIRWTTLWPTRSKKVCFFCMYLIFFDSFQTHYLFTIFSFNLLIFCSQMLFVVFFCRMFVCCLKIFFCSLPSVCLKMF